MIHRAFSNFPCQHIRGKWVCTECETLTQAAVPAHVIDKGLPTTCLLVHVLVAKYADHLPLYRQEQIFCDDYSGYKILDPQQRHAIRQPLGAGPQQLATGNRCQGVMVGRLFLNYLS